MSLESFWSSFGCLIGQPYPSEVGAGTFNPLTFFKVLDNNPWNVAYIELSKRPKDGRYGANPNRLCSFHQYQVILKPSPNDVQSIYLNSLEKIGLDIKNHDIRFVEDDWESETLGARGLGWEVWYDGMEITQFTYFQYMGDIPLDMISVELTYGLARIALILQKKSSVFEVEWSKGVTYGDLYNVDEYEFSQFNFDYASPELYLELFAKFEFESQRFLSLSLLYPAYDYVIKCSHILNILDARKVLSPIERKNYITRVRKLSNACANLFLKRLHKNGIKK